MSVVPAGASTIFGVPSGWIQVTLGMAGGALPEQYAYAFELSDPSAGRL